MRVFRHTRLRGSRVVGESNAAERSRGSRLAQVQTPLDKSARCVGEAGACRRVRSHHGSRQFEKGPAMAAGRSLQTVMISCPSRPPNNRVKSNRCQASRLRSRHVIGGSFPVCHGSLTAAVAHPSRSIQAVRALRDTGVGTGTAWREFEKSQLISRNSRSRGDAIRQSSDSAPPPTRECLGLLINRFVRLL